MIPFDRCHEDDFIRSASLFAFILLKGGEVHRSIIGIAAHQNEVGRMGRRKSTGLVGMPSVHTCVSQTLMF